MLNILKENINNRPIGIANKNYQYMVESLQRNIGSLEQDADKYGTPIGMLASFEGDNKGWFMTDPSKQAYYDYVSYVEKEHFENTKNVVDFLTTEQKMQDGSTYLQSLRLDNNSVGVVRNYDYANDDITKDTNVGYINNFYLNNTIRNTIFNSKELAKNGNGITNGLSYLFSVDGEYGIMTNGFKNVKGRVKTQRELTGDIIAWSTVDEYYNSLYQSKDRVANLNSNINGSSIVDKIYRVLPYEVSEIFGDNNLGGDKSNIYNPFGNFYSLTYSLGLISATNDKTQDLIIRSLLGYDLLETNYGGLLSLDFLNDNTVANPRKKYYVANGSRGTNYIDMMVGVLPSNSSNIDSVGGAKAIRYDGSIVRTDLIDAGNDTLWAAKTLWAYAESEGKNTSSPMGNGVVSANRGVAYGTYKQYANDDIANKQDIIYKTNQHFQQHHLDTIVGRFHTDKLGSITEARANRDLFTNAISQYGMSRGRNLLKRKPSYSNGYSNPYCRVWTYHHQYQSLQDSIRPFIEEDDNGNTLRSSLANTELEFYRPQGEGSFKGSMITRLEELGVKSKNNGQVKFTPLVDDENDNIVNRAENCMFSIENLAWKGFGRKGSQYDLDDDQRGPLGGRIMWFPPYDIQFNEDSSVQWNGTQFIGRGEQIYTYVNTERSGTLSFTLLIDHPSVVNSWRGDVSGGHGVGDVDDVNSSEQQLLRFFAGCETLQKKPRQNKKQKSNDGKIILDTIAGRDDEKFIFFVYFPNNYTGKDDINTIVNPIEYILNGVGGQKKLVNGKLVDLSTTMDENYVSNSKYINGYEVIENPNMGISIVNYYNPPIISGVADAIIYSDSNIIISKYSSGDANSKYWAYRVDKAYAKQNLSVDDYYDKNSFGLNGDNYADALQYHGLTAKTIVDKCYSFTDAYVAITNKGNDILPTEKESVNILKSLLEKHKVSKVVINGCASSHGYSQENITIAKNRAETIKQWLIQTNSNIFSSDIIETGIIEGTPQLSSNDVSSKEAKIWRSVKVEIYYNTEDINDVTDINNVNKVTSSTYNPSNINLRDNQTAKSVEDVELLFNTLLSEYAGEITEQELRDYIEYIQNPYNNSSNLSKVQLKAIGSLIEKYKAERDAKINNNSVYKKTYYEANRYKDEYRFFNELKINEPFMHSKLVEKIKYFDPAFHSITPEGFNARLTFLHQCTRQGSTVGNSDTKGNADNIAFGTPPICVLRLGDFFYTKILIENLSIDYNNATWDLNEEGIGVMPMMAKVTIRFRFIGGSDLGGPITRLQNAVSFNYYANTGVYDNRSEMVKYDDNGKIDKFKSTTIK